MRRRQFVPSSEFQEHFVMPATRKRSHANGWVATVFKNELELVEGYLWNEHHEPVEVRREGRDLKSTQLELDDATRRLGHVCSEQCKAWSSRPPPGYFR